MPNPPNPPKCQMLSAFEGFLSDNRKIGIILTIIGGVLLVMGVLLVFDPVLLAMGNFLFIGYENNVFL